MRGMTVKRAREAAREWVLQSEAHSPGFAGAYTAGSTNWLAADAEVPPASDVDVMVVLADESRAGERRKFVYRDTLLEISYLRKNQLESPDQVLSDYHLAPSLRTAEILLDPTGHLTSLQAAVARDYAKPRWVRRRCVHAADKARNAARSASEGAALHDQVIACLFAAGITTHVLLVAGLRNPTVRSRYVAVRELLAEYGHPNFHDELLELLGSARITQKQAGRHVASLSGVFDAAKTALKTSFPFASDIGECARPIAIDASLELIGHGYHREAMFWVAATHSRCQKVLACDSPGSDGTIQCELPGVARRPRFGHLRRNPATVFRDRTDSTSRARRGGTDYGRDFRN